MMKHKTAGGVSAWRELLLAALIGMAGTWSLLSLYFWMLFINQIHYLVENSPIPAEISSITLAFGVLILPEAAAGPVAVRILRRPESGPLASRKK